MPRPNLEGMPRPERVTHEQVVVGKRRPFKELSDQISYKQTEAQTGNKKTKACCRNLGNLDVETVKTNPSLPVPDMMKLICNKCGAVHYRTAMGAGRTG